MTLTDHFTAPQQRTDSRTPDIHLPTQDRVETAPGADHDHDDHDESHLIRGYD
ncbi:hypothetical protein [Saccharopolyspora pogona]|uniref:hypothetical protein n=1 Tax=Saccharopolyspora pogona TaxID=333966 RepID=UPI0016837C71|nr:hypothetical protein [Saccharopolyspora pogona]